MRMQLPAAVMKCSPTPRIIRGPIPALIRPNPATLIPVWSPIRRANHNRRLPAPLTVLSENPSPIRTKLLIKIGHIRIGRGLRDHGCNRRGNAWLWLPLWRLSRRGNLLRLRRCHCRLRRRRQRGSRSMSARKHGIQNRCRNTPVAQIENAVSRQIVVDILVLNVGYNRFLVHGRILQFENFVHSDRVLSLNAGCGTPEGECDQTDLPSKIVYMHNPVPFERLDVACAVHIQHAPATHTTIESIIHNTTPYKRICNSD